MAETEEERNARKKDLAESVAEGLSIFRSREEEAAAKRAAEEAAKGGTDDTDNGSKPRRSLAEWLLG